VVPAIRLGALVRQPAERLFQGLVFARHPKWLKFTN
jgi:hypothetical protein